MFNRRLHRVAFVCGVVAVALTPAAQADDVSGADRILCASIEATRCDLDGCVTGDPVLWNIPQFIEIDLVAKRLQTTAASGENRATPITTLMREDGSVFIQGIEGGRAFSLVIHEASGELNAAVAASSGSSTAVFAACTPLPASE
jgi:hypothetical protein